MKGDRHTSEIGRSHIAWIFAGIGFLMLAGGAARIQDLTAEIEDDTRQLEQKDHRIAELLEMLTAARGASG